MTDQDNLRDRIADIIDKTDVEAGDEDDHNIALAESADVAQAIIDELGLTTETHAATHAKRTMTRITGAWEWEKQ